jgi:hypothetical protein
MIHTTKCNISWSSIYRYTQMFNAVSSYDAADITSVSNFFPNPTNNVIIYGPNRLCRPYLVKIVIIWGDFVWYVVLYTLWTEVGVWQSWNHKQHCARSAPLYNAMMNGSFALLKCHLVGFEWKFEDYAQLLKRTWPNCYY